MVTAQCILDAAPTVIQVVPLTSTLQGFHIEVVIEPDPANGLARCADGTRERMTGIEPAYSAWEALFSRLHRACVSGVVPGQGQCLGLLVLRVVVPNCTLLSAVLGTN